MLEFAEKPQKSKVALAILMVLILMKIRGLIITEVQRLQSMKTNLRELVMMKFLPL